MFQLYHFILIVLVINYVESQGNNLSVETNVGTIRGVNDAATNINMYLGIPYAQVDRNNPFGASLPYPKFDGIFEANDDSKICPQPEIWPSTTPVIPLGTLDCLNMNIYTPENVTATSNLPVMVWIFGGGFRWGSAKTMAYGPKFLVKHDVILVNINYRIGPYGFICLDIPEVPGNQGLRDQVDAFRWIKENIQYFGGDPNRITAFGESAGGSSVDILMRSEYEQLFNNGIMQSGTATRPLVYPGSDGLFTVAEAVGYSGNDVKEALEFLANVEPDTLITTITEIGYQFQPCIENDFPGVKKMIAEFHANGEIPKAKDISLMVGFNDNEANHIVAGLPPFLLPNFPAFDQMRDNFDFEEELIQELMAITRRFYLGDQPISMANRFELSNYMTDAWYSAPIQRSMRKFLENDVKQMYYYVFSYVGDRNIMRRNDNVTFGGAAHMDELGYLFDMPRVLEDEPSPQDQLVIDRITTLWTNFAKYSNPTPETSNLIPVKWLPITPQDPRYHYIDIGSELKTGKRPYRDRLAYWNLYFTAYAKNEIGNNAGSQ